jgi:hypothetical protein
MTAIGCSASGVRIEYNTGRLQGTDSAQRVENRGTSFG